VDLNGIKSSEDEMHGLSVSNGRRIDVRKEVRPAL